MIASRLHWRLLMGTVLALMAAAWLVPRWVPAPHIQENRVLAAAPAWPTGLGHFRAFRRAADAYVADRFPIRPHLIGILNRVRMVAGVSGSKRVIVGRDGWLFYDDDTHLGSARGDPPMVGPEVRQWLLTLAGRTEALQARHIAYVVMAAPAKETVYPQFGPAWYHGPSATRPTLLLAKLAHDAGVGDVLYLHGPVAAATRSGAKTYSRHDTHWTGYGAYAGYAALVDHLHALGLTDGPRPLSAFEMIEGGFGNRPRDLALMLGVASFVDIDFPHIDNPAGVGKIATQYLSAKQDWTAPQVIETGEVGKPTLLMTRDSFSNEIQPLLYPHFSRIVLAHNQDGAWRQDLIDRFKPDVVVLEVVEHGLRVSMGDGPAPSAAAAARIDHVLASLASTAPASSGPGMPSLSPPDAATAAVMARAQPSGNCNLEIVTLTPGLGGEATFTASGWISEVGRRVTAPEGFVALRGPGGVFVAPVEMDKSRPDVAAFYKNPNAEKSGFVGTFFLRKIAPGAYTPSAYRRAGSGWIACVGKATVAAP